MQALKAETGETLGAFVRALSLERADDLLRTEDDPIKLIVTKVGFASPAAFSTAFRRETGKSPLEFGTWANALEWVAVS